MSGLDEIRAANNGVCMKVAYNRGTLRWSRALKTFTDNKGNPVIDNTFASLKQAEAYVRKLNLAFPPLFVE